MLRGRRPRTGRPPPVGRSCCLRSLPLKIDNEVPNLGRLHATRRVARMSMAAQGEPPGVTHVEPVWRRDRTSRMVVGLLPLVLSWPRERGGGSRTVG